MKKLLAVDFARSIPSHTVPVSPVWAKLPGVTGVDSTTAFWGAACGNSWRLLRDIGELVMEEFGARNAAIKEWVLPVLEWYTEWCSGANYTTTRWTRRSSSIVGTCGGPRAQFVW